MRTLVDASFRAEAREYSLRFNCEHCVHFDVPSEACAEGYPNQAHRAARLDLVPSLEFCKSFELA
jgi:hypothetical protein